MLESQRITQQVNELEGRMDALSAEIDAMPEVRAEESGYDEYVSQRSQKVRELNDLVRQFNAATVRLREATTKEEREAQAAMASHVDTDGWSQELRDFRDLAQRTSIADFLVAAANQRSVEGASAEYRQEVLEIPADAGGNGEVFFPIEMMIDRQERFDMNAAEHRALATVTADTSVMQESIAARLFATGESAFIGASFPAAAPGQHSFPVVTTSAIAQRYNRDQDETIGAGEITTVTATPKRVQMSYEWAAEDELRVTGLEAALAGDLRMAASAGLDNFTIDQVLALLTNPTAPTTQAKLEDYLAAFSDGVDAKAAMDYMQVRVLVGLATYHHAYKTSIANIAHAMQILPRDRFKPSAHIAAPQSNDQSAIVYRMGMPSVRRLFVPVWRRAELIRDRVTKQTKGQIRVTAALYADPILSAQDLHDEIAFQLA